MAIDFGRFDWRSAQSDLLRLQLGQWNGRPDLEAAFLRGYGEDPRTNSWQLELIYQAVANTYEGESQVLYRVFAKDAKASVSCMDLVFSKGNAKVTEGALFYGQTRRRLDVPFDDILRRETEDTARQVRELLNSGKTPKPVYAKRCKNCSLMADCLPKAIQKRRSVKSYLQRMTGES